MRYYDITIRNPVTKAVVVLDDVLGTFVDTPRSVSSPSVLPSGSANFGSGRVPNPGPNTPGRVTSGNAQTIPKASSTFASHTAAGLFIPGALNVELDIPSLPFGTFQGNIFVRVWGVPITALGQASNLNGFDIEILGGMKPPYGLNAAAKPGQLAVGQILQAYGNWEGQNQHLDLIINNSAANPNATANIAFTWAAQESIADAIVQALTAAFPGFTILGADTLQRLVQDHAEPTMHTSLQSFCEYILNRTQSPGYGGVQIRGVGTTFYLYDGTQATKPTQIQFPDIIGQPTWMSAAGISFSTVMRGDIVLGSRVLMPRGLFPPYTIVVPNTDTPTVLPANRLNFQGNFIVTEVHHFGDFRQPDAASWRTNFLVVPDLGADPNQFAGESGSSARGLA